MEIVDNGILLVWPSAMDAGAGRSAVLGLARDLAGGRVRGHGAGEPGHDRPRARAREGARRPLRACRARRTPRVLRAVRAGFGPVPDAGRWSAMLPGMSQRPRSGHRPAAGRQGRRDRRDRARAARVHDPGRPRRRRDPGRAARRAAARGRRARCCSTAAGPSVALDLKQPEAVGDGARAGRGRRPAGRGDAAGRRRAARDRPRAVPRGQPAAGLRADDRLGPGRPAGPGGRPRHELHLDRRRAVRHGPDARAGRSSRPTWSATSAAGRRTSSSACSPRCSRPGCRGQGQVVDAAIVDGTAHLNAMTVGVPRERRLPGGGAARTCSTAACRSTTSTRPPTAGTCRSARWSRSSTPR